MKVSGKHYRTIWLKEDDDSVVRIIDQRHLPHRFVIEDLHTVDEVAIAIRDMHVRGAGLIGAAAGYGMYLAALAAPRDAFGASVREAEMAEGIVKLVRGGGSSQGVFVMAGHEDGVIAYGADIESARRVLLDTHQQMLTT